jgi:hypothetical protein
MSGVQCDELLPSHLHLPMITMPLAVLRALYWLGVALMLIALADALLVRLARIDLTGSTALPLGLGLAGIVLMWLSRMLPQRGE